MKPLFFSPAAETDLEAIWDYSAAMWGPDQADRYIDDIRGACLALAAGTKRGTAVDVRPGYRKLAVGAHRLYFRDQQDGIIMIRILHGRQDSDRHIEHDPLT